MDEVECAEGVDFEGLQHGGARHDGEGFGGCDVAWFVACFLLGQDGWDEPADAGAVED